MRRLLAVAVGIAITAPAVAQTSAAPAPSTQGMGGPVVAGVCLLSREAMFANAKVGVAATARLQQLTDVAKAEIDAQRKPVETDIAALRSDTKLTADARTQREQALLARLQPIQMLAQQRSREIEATRVKALQRIADQAAPAIAQVYGAHKCGLLIDRNTVLGGNFANDLTADVVKALDARISTITFDRETLPAAPAKAS